MYNRGVQLKVPLKKLKCMIAPDKICMLKAQRSIILISTDAICDAEKQKKHNAANWVAPPVTLTGHIGSLREHTYAALVGAGKWPTFVLVGMSLYVSLAAL